MPLAPQAFTLDNPAGERLAGLRIGPVEVVLGAQGGKYPDGNHVMVSGRDGCVSFDLPPVSRVRPERLARADFVVLGHVHEDHTAGLSLLPRVPVHVHEGDVAAMRSLDGLALHYGYRPTVTAELCRRAVERFHYAPRPDAIAYADGATWDLGGVRVRAVHAPGHTSGHCILLVEPDGIAFIGDIDLSSFGPYYGDATSDLAAFRTTLRQVRDLPAVCWITSHHKGVVSSRERFLEQMQAFGAALDRRQAALLDALRARPQSLHDLVRTRFVYPPSFDDAFVDDAERRVIGQHLDELLAEGRIVRRDDGVFAAAG
jgi:glyoxylase-like metal-dependent hydrolase (beta-lactamase superfamily II)